MTDRKWTPGPWVVTGVEYDDVRIETLHPMPEASHAYGDQTIIGSSEWTYLEDANAHLIAAAPDLYDALEGLWMWVKNWDVEFMDDPEFDRSIIESALAKARGET
jgi:hypothetical protein